MRAEVSTLRALRILRVLRSLRFLQGIKTIMSIVAQALPNSVNVVLFLAFLFVVMGIIGVQMFRGKMIHRCAPGGFGLMGSYTDIYVDGGALQSTSSLAAEVYPLSSNLLVDGLALNATNSPAKVCDGSQGSEDFQQTLGLSGEYPIGIGVWESYCGVELERSGGDSWSFWRSDTTPAGLKHRDCPLFNQTMYDETGCSPQLCFVTPNPGKGVHSYDNIFFAWCTLFINMACLYWWETAHRFADAGWDAGWDDMGGKIAWGYGITNVFLLTYVCVSMFIAVITTTFADVRSMENESGGLKAEGMSQAERRDNEEKQRERIATAWKKPAYYVQMFGGDGPYAEESKPGRNGYPLSVAMRDETEVTAYSPSSKSWGKGTVVEIDEAEAKYRVKFSDAGEGEGEWLQRNRIKVPKGLEKCGLIYHPLFDQIILAFIVFNTVCLSAEHHDPSACAGSGEPEIMCQSEAYIGMMGMLEYLFNFVFTCECIMKVCGMGFKPYIAVAFNKLDFFIVVTSILDMLSAIMPSDEEGGGGGGIFKLFRVFRLFRVLRVARILYRNESLKRLLMTVFGSGEALGNLTLFILFGTLLFGIMGMHLFGGNYIEIDGTESFWGQLNGAATYFRQRDQASGNWSSFAHEHDSRHTYGYDVPDLINKSLIPRRNFEDLPRAFLLAFQIITGDDWVNQMHDHMAIYNLWTPPMLFFSSFIFCNYTLLSLFIAVILENFEIAEAEKLEKQKEAAAKKKEKEVLAKTTARVTFIDRLIYLVGGAGRAEGKLCSPRKDIPLDDEGYLTAGEKWYNNDSALFMFGPEHPLRVSCYKLANHVVFDGFILTCIIVSTIMLIYEGPPGARDQDILDIFKLVNHFLFAAFMVELVVKCIGYGFIFTPKSYIKDPWNKLDFIVILASALGYVPGQEDSQLGRVLRLGRCLRPLRIINRNEGMKVIISAVIGSLGVNLSVLALMFMLFLIFGILGVNLFAGQFWFCNCSHVYPAGTSLLDIVAGRGAVNGILPQQVQTKDQCVGPCSGDDVRGSEGGSIEGSLDALYCVRNGTIWGVDPAFPDAISKCAWENPPYSFDDIGEAIMALFTASTLAGWTDIAERSMDMTGFNMQPVYFNSGWAVVYWIMFVFILAFFITNLFIGVLIDYIGQNDGSALLTEEQQAWADTQRFQKQHETIEEEVDLDAMHSVRRFFWKTVETPEWESFNNFAILFNVFVMMMEYEGMGAAYWAVLQDLNFICLVYFTVEMACKLIGYLPAKYWSDNWNRFDGFVVVLSWLAIIFDLGSVQAVRAFRSIRIVYRMESAKGIRSLVSTLIMSIPAVGNIIVLIGLLYTLFAILGMQLFGTAALQDQVYWTKPVVQRDGSLCDASELEGLFPKPGCVRMIGQRDYDEQCSSPGDSCVLTTGRMLHGGNRQYSSHASFGNFFDAMALLFQCAAGQDWKFVMYNLTSNREGDPGFSKYGVFLYFSLFFFFSNYILLNLFIAVILDNFSACLREEDLEVDEEQIVLFKETFRDNCTEDSVERIYFSRLEEIMMALSEKRKEADVGKEGVENPLTPPAVKPWNERQKQAWDKVCREHKGKIQRGYGLKGGESVRELVRAAYECTPLLGADGGLCNPLYGKGEPGGFEPEGSNPNGGGFDAYWADFISTRTTSEERPGDGDPAMEDLLDCAQAGGVETFDGTVAFDVLEDFVRRLRFRMHYQRLVGELDVHSVKYVDETSTIRYTDLLQGLVNARLGAKALSLEEQVARGLITLDVAQAEAAAEAEQAMGEREQSTPPDPVTANPLLEPDSPTSPATGVRD